MITIELQGDGELIKGIKIMRELGFTDEEIQKKYDEQIKIDSTQNVERN